MKTITRNAPPACRQQQVPTQDWLAFMNTPCHDELGRNLRQEQHGLCCYCELEVADNTSGHIEHMEPRNPPHPMPRSRRTYDYSNLAMSCNGGVGEHCGHFKD